MPLLREARSRHCADISEAKNADVHVLREAKNVVRKTQDLTPPGRATSFRNGAHSTLRNAGDTVPANCASSSFIAADLRKPRFLCSATRTSAHSGPISTMTLTSSRFTKSLRSLKSLIYTPGANCHRTPKSAVPDHDCSESSICQPSCVPSRMTRRHIEPFASRQPATNPPPPSAFHRGASCCFDQRKDPSLTG